MKTSAQATHRPFFWKKLFQFFFVLPMLVLFLFQITPAYAGISKQINFQGKLVDNNGLTVADGTQYQLIFSLYNVNSGGSAIWTETQSNITVSGGIFQVILGSVTSLSGVDFNNSSIYLGITVSKNGSGGTTGDSEMTPRIQFNGVPYAFNADKLDGVVATNSATSFTITGSTNALQTLTVNGNITIGSTITPTAAGTLAVQSNGANGLTLDAGGLSSVSVGAANANAMTIGNTTNTATIGINTSATTATGVTVTANGITNGTGLLITSSGTIVTPGKLVSIVGNNTTTGNVLNISGTGLTQGYVFNAVGGTAVTTGGDLYLNGAVYQHGVAGQAGSLATVSFTDNTNLAGSSTTNGLLVSSVFNLQGASGAKQVSGISVGAPTITGCSGGTTCTWDGLQINTASTTNTSVTQNGLHIIPSGVAPSGTWNGILVDTTSIGAPIGASYTGINISGITSSGSATENALKIGSGWSNAISAAGNIRIEAQTNTTLGNQQTFWKVSQATAGTISNNGGDTTSIASISASAVFNGSLYVGTTKDTGAEVYRYNGTSGSWTKVSQATAGTISNNGGDTTSIASISAMTVFNGNLYVGTTKIGKGEVYRYNGGTNWTAVDVAAGQLKTTAAIDGVTSLAVFGGNLYAGTRKSGQAEIYEYNGGTTWTAINTTAGTFIATNAVAIDAVTSMVVKNGWLYFGTVKAGGANVIRWDGGLGNTNANFQNVNGASATGSYTINGTAQAGYNEVTALTVYNGALVVALRRSPGQVDVLSLNDGNSTAVTSTPDNWVRLNSAIGTMTTGGTSSIDSALSLIVYNGRLYAGTKIGGKSNAELYRYESPGVWTRLNPTGFLSGTTTPTGGIDGISMLQPYNGLLFIGTQKISGGAEVYQYNALLDQSYALTFHATPGLAGGEQNSLTNQGSIFFVASQSGSLNSTGAQSGSFEFTTGIQTTTGAYDVAEDYPTRDDQIKPGDLVAINTLEKGLVQRSIVSNDPTVIGVYSSHPALDLSQQGNQINGLPAIAVALVGRVSINVSTESGQIKQGDYLVSSSIPGVAMKANKPGPVIAQALEDYSGNGTGQILGFVEHGYSNGVDSVNSIASGDPLSIIAELQTHLQQQQNVLTDFIASTSAVLSAMTATPSSDLSLTSLSVDGLATISGDLRIKGNTLIEGMLHVIDTLTANNFIVTNISDFLGQVIFHNDVLFNGHATVNSDTAGIAIVKKGTSSMDVIFSKPYTTVPVVTITLVADGSMGSQNALQQQILQNNYSYLIGNKTKTGFTVVLNKVALEDISFSWIALGVTGLQESTTSSLLTPTDFPSASVSSIPSDIFLLSPTQIPIVIQSPTPTP